MKKPVFFILVAILAIYSISYGHALDAPDNSSHAVILMHADTGTVLMEQNADERLLIASTTKVMTALVALENSSPDDIVSIDYECTTVEGSSMYLKTGEEYTVLQLLYGLLLVSGNDAALALAQHVGGGVDGFAALMNDKAARLGLENSSFKNPHGLDAQGHFSSARDLAIIMAAAMDNELFAQIVMSRSYTIGENTYYNHNKLLWNYDGVIGGKTGYTMAAGRSLISCAERDGMRLICVTISDPDDWRDHMALYDWAYSEYEYKSVIPEGQYSTIPVVSGEYDEVGIAPTGELRVLVRGDAEIRVKARIPRFAFADVSSGERAGSLIVYMDGRQIGEIGLCYTGDVAVAEGIKLSKWEKFVRGWKLANRYGPFGYGYGL